MNQYLEYHDILNCRNDLIDLMESPAGFVGEDGQFHPYYNAEELGEDFIQSLSDTSEK